MLAIHAMCSQTTFYLILPPPHLVYVLNYIVTYAYYAPYIHVCDSIVIYLE